MAAPEAAEPAAALSAVVPRPPPSSHPGRSSPASRPAYGRFAAPVRSGRRPQSARTARRFRVAREVPTLAVRPQTAMAAAATAAEPAPKRADSRPNYMRSMSRSPRLSRSHRQALSPRRKGALVDTLRKEKVVNALFLRLQYGDGGSSDAELRRLARVAAGGARNAPPALLRLVDAEATAIVEQLNRTDPAALASSARVPTRISRCISPRGVAPKAGSFAESIAAAQRRIAQKLAADAAEMKQAAAAAAAKTSAAKAVTLSTGPPTVRPQPFVRPARPMVNLCGRNVPLMPFLREKLMARGKSDNAVMRHVLFTHDTDRSGEISRAELVEFLRSVQVTSRPSFRSPTPPPRSPPIPRWLCQAVAQPQQPPHIRAAAAAPRPRGAPTI
jgi:hypothetical protein